MIADHEIRSLLEPMIARRTRFVACERPAADVLVATRFGGRPAGLRGESWPMCTCGNPLQFVGQISGIDAPIFVSWFQLATVFFCWSHWERGEQAFSAPERPWRGWCVRAYPSSRADENVLAVYADWLQSRGDPNGELIALALAIESARDAGERGARRQALRERLLAHAVLPEPAAWDGPRLDGDRDEFALLALPDLAYLELPPEQDAEAEFLFPDGFVRPVRELSLPCWQSLELRVPVTRALFDAADDPHALGLRIERIADELTGVPRGRMPRNYGLALGGWARWIHNHDETPVCERCGDAMELFAQFQPGGALHADWASMTLFTFVCAVHRDHYGVRMQR